MKKIRVGTRGSLLALTQAGIVVSALRERFPDIQVETLEIKTTGDAVLDRPLTQIGSKGLFTKEIEEALIEGRIDLAVHSLKDLSAEIPGPLVLGAVTRREDPRDCLISKKAWSLKTLPRGATVGTGSLRRRAQVLSLRPDLKVEDLRGNLDTRIRKLLEDRFDAIVAARAGLNRLEKSLPAECKSLSFKTIPRSEMLPAVGQGFLGIEIRKGDPETEQLVRILDHQASHQTALCERAFLAELQGGCQVPIGVWTEVKGGKLSLEGLIASIDGGKVVLDKISGGLERGPDLGKELGKKLLGMGGKQILESIRARE